jgi:hypothetical protein
MKGVINKIIMDIKADTALNKPENQKPIEHYRKIIHDLYMNMEVDCPYCNGYGRIDKSNINHIVSVINPLDFPCGNCKNGKIKLKELIGGKE